MAKKNNKRIQPRKPIESPATAEEDIFHELDQRSIELEGKQKAKFEYEDIIDKISGRSSIQITNGWLAHIPELGTIGLNPSAAMEVRNEVLKSNYSEATQEKPAIVQVSGIRDAILHEALYLLHKAAHVELLCARHMQHGRYTWAVSDAYQASLFALSSFLALNGIIFTRNNNDHLIVDAWLPAPEVVVPVHTPQTKPKRVLKSWQEEREADFQAEEDSLSAIKLTDDSNAGDPTLPNLHACHILKFKKLDHFHKWAVLKRVVRSIQGDKTKALRTLRDVLNGKDDKQFAAYRNTLHYQSDGWIYSDLLNDLEQPPFKLADSIQEMYEEMYKGTAAGGIFLMVLLIEMCCVAVERILLAGAKQLEQEVATLKYRYGHISAFLNFDPSLLRRTD